MGSASTTTKLALVVAMFGIAQAITCGELSRTLLPCFNYVRNGGDVPADCCNGVRNLKGFATTTASRQTICNCLKGTAADIPGLNTTLAEELPDKCGVDHVPFKISPSTDCSSVQ